MLKKQCLYHIMVINNIISRCTFLYVIYTNAANGLTGASFPLKDREDFERLGIGSSGSILLSKLAIKVIVNISSTIVIISWHASAARDTVII